jgi:hypothetical protein
MQRRQPPRLTQALPLGQIGGVTQLQSGGVALQPGLAR